VEGTVTGMKRGVQRPVLYWKFNAFRESFRIATYLRGSKSVTSNIDAKTVNVSEHIHRYPLPFMARLLSS
jgi:hypothetical protein